MSSSTERCREIRLREVSSREDPTDKSEMTGLNLDQSSREASSNDA